MGMKGLAGALLIALGMGSVAADVPVETHGAGASRYTLAPFGDVIVQRPAGEPRGVVLFLSDADGWTRDEMLMARAMADKGVLVAGVSTPALARAMESNSAKCVDPNYPLIDLARDLQHRMGVATYRKPIVAGYGSGAAMAYAALSQWPNAGYQAVVSIDFAPIVAGRKPWCRSPGFITHRMVGRAGEWHFPANRRIAVPWLVLQQREGQTQPMATTRAFVQRVPGARLIELPGGGAGDAGPARWTPQLLSALTPLLPPPPPRAAPGQIAIPDMPLTLVPARAGSQSDMMAILYSGDGGWVGIDHDVAAQLAGAGISVVGVDSLSYFWSARTPRGAGHDLSQLIGAFSQRWNKRRVLLVGYSFGADVMPHMVLNLDPAARAKVAAMALMGFSSSADFQFHMTSWLNISSDAALPTLPAVARLKGLTIRCVRGMSESDSACPAIPPGVAQQFLVPGDHHFNRNAPLLAHIILGQRRPGRVTR